jgi:transcription initiation factor IIE alpha subunit
MSQREILTLLEKHKSKWWTSKEICNKLRNMDTSILKSLRKLREYKEVNIN